MKNIYIIKTLLIFAIFATTSVGCKKALDINESPNNPSLDKGVPEQIFPVAVASTAGRIGGEYAILGGIWAQFWAQSAVSSQFRSFDSYNLTQSDLNGSFDETFAGALGDYTYAIKKAEELQNWKFYLMCTVMRAYTYQVMVDLYDTVPYSEAFQGKDNLTPKFDDGYSIYINLLKEIDNALSKDYNSGNPAVKPDVVFGDKMEKWVAFANTLKLKMYLRMVYAKPTEAEAGIKKLYTDGATFLTEDAAINNFVDAENYSNPLYEYNFRKLNTNGNLRASRTMLTFLQENADPRIAAYYTMSGTTYIGLNQGDYNNPDPALTSLSIAVVKATDPVQFISKAESYFLQAEALERYFAGAGAKTAYDAGVTAAFAQYDLDADAATFLATGGKYVYPSAGSFETKLESIIVQKWASFPGAHALEAFFEKNRTGYPKSSTVYSTDDSYIPGELVYPKNAVTGGKYPKRLIIPESERKTNPNTPAVRPLTENVWWDKK